MFSISIPVLDQQAFIQTALSSVQIQTVAYELAVMDATADNSVQRILDQYTGTISYRRHGKDGGQSEAIKEGWDNTSGDIVSWLCADDYYFPDTLQVVQACFEQHPEVDVVYGDCVFVDCDNHFKMYFPAIERDVSCLPVHDCISQPSCFIRRKALEDAGNLNTSLHYVMDWDLWVRLYNNGATFHYLHKPLSLSRIYPGTKTGSMSIKRYQEINTQLMMQPSHLRRISGLVGTLYYDLRENRHNVVMDALFLLLDICRRAKGKRFPSSLGLLYGLDMWTNYFSDRCEISLAWYNRKRPEKVVLEIAPAVSVSIICNGSALDLIKQTEQGECIFSLPKDLVSKSCPCLTFQVILNPAKRCQLRSFVVE